MNHCNSQPERRTPFIRQSILVTGLDTTGFQSYIDNLRILHQKLSRQFPDKAMQDFTPSTYMEYMALAIGTRYFTDRRHDNSSPHIPFEHAIDPKGILTSLANSRYFHGQDNCVLYYKLKSDRTRHW
jgi:hypothetical protein